MNSSRNFPCLLFTSIIGLLAEKIEISQHVAALKKKLPIRKINAQVTRVAHPNVKIIDLLVLCANVSSVTEEDINQNSRDGKPVWVKLLPNILGPKYYKLAKKELVAKLRTLIVISTQSKLGNGFTLFLTHSLQNVHFSCTKEHFIAPSNLGILRGRKIQHQDYCLELHLALKNGAIWEPKQVLE